MNCFREAGFINSPLSLVEIGNYEPELQNMWDNLSMFELIPVDLTPVDYINVDISLATNQSQTEVAQNQLILESNEDDDFEIVEERIRETPSCSQALQAILRNLSCHKPNP